MGSHLDVGLKFASSKYFGLKINLSWLKNVIWVILCINKLEFFFFFLTVTPNNKKTQTCYFKRACLSKQYMIWAYWNILTQNKTHQKNFKNLQRFFNYIKFPYIISVPKFFNNPQIIYYQLTVKVFLPLPSNFTISHNLAPTF